MKIAIIGIGNKIMGDDGFGAFLVSSMIKNCEKNQCLDFIDLEIRSIELINYIEDKDLIVIIDVAKEIEKIVEVYEVNNEQLSKVKLSDLIELSNINIHELTAITTIILAKLTKYFNGKAYAILVKAKNLSHGKPLSKEVVTTIPIVLDYVRAILRKHGVNLRCRYTEILKEMWNYCDIEKIIQDLRISKHGT